MPNDVDFSNVQVFSGDLIPKQDTTPAVMTEISTSREVAEVQGAIIVAKKFPRNQAQALDRILIACQRPSLAETALYSYARGGTAITGPSIRLAETVAQNWGNLSFGVRELEQRNGESTVESFAIDLETNTRQVKIFQVKHKRYTKQGTKDLTDPRDIYEHIANNAARRLRACILGIIPGDVVESAVNQCEQTLKAKADLSPEAIKKMVTAFESFGVTKEQIETRIQRKLDSITAAQVIALRKIYNSLKDGMSKAVDWFEEIEIKQAAKQPKKESKAAQAPPPSDQPPANGNVQAEGENSTQVDMATPHQINWLNEWCKTNDYPIDTLCDDCGVKHLIELTYDQAQAMIGKLGD